MDFLYSFSLLMLVIATVFTARIIRQYLDGLKKAGEVLLTLPRKRYNADVVGSIFFTLVGINDLYSGEYMFGGIIMVFCVMLYVRGVKPYQFHENGLFLEMEFFSWDELRLWAWDENEKPEVMLKFEGKPSRSIRTTSGKSEMQMLFEKYASKASQNKK